jgi:hypothetical protein
VSIATKEQCGSGRALEAEHAFEIEEACQIDSLANGICRIRAGTDIRFSFLHHVMEALETSEAKHDVEMEQN